MAAITRELGINTELDFNSKNSSGQDFMEQGQEIVEVGGIEGEQIVNQEDLTGETTTIVAN